MQKVKQIIDEIKELKTEVSHKSALRIFSLVENNKKLFDAVMEENDLNFVISNFENLSYKNPTEFSKVSTQEEYRKLIENFLFHCSRVV